ncbi:MAG: hypothetical protein QOJ13_2187 [Gaiellales bacterium]|jgi:hypothetical protein|nr:hypothetical protein [Gaiellales bacterium]
MEFIFMLTRNDSTLPDARSVFEGISAGVQHVGCKDVGLPEPELAEFLGAVRDRGCATYLEVVSETADAELRSAQAAVRLAPDYLIGGTQVEDVQRIIAGSAIRYFPYVGQIVGHPCLLRGSVDEICDDARRVQAQGVDGINLLAYRYDGDAPALIRAVSEASSLPLICAGSVDSVERIRELADLGVWAFTVGTAALNGEFIPGGTLDEQLQAILSAGEGAAQPT